MIRIGTCGAARQTCSKLAMPWLSGRYRSSRTAAIPLPAQPLEPLGEPRRAFDDERAVVRVRERPAHRSDIVGVAADQKNPHRFEVHRHGRIL